MQFGYSHLREDHCVQPHNMRVGLFILAVVVDLRSFAGNLSSTDNSSLQYPSGDVRSCPTQRLDGDGLLRQMEVLPGAGFDNLRNLPMGEVYDYTYSKCMISKDGRFLLPDNVFLIPVQESKLEVFAEVFNHWSAYSSVNSRSINAEASFFSLISGKFSSEHLSMKTHQVSNSAKTTRVQLRHHFYSVKIQPDAQLSSSFKSRILDIAAYLQNNQSDYAEYLAELIVRDYGTHYISSADAGGIVYQLDYISSDYLNDVNVDSRSVTASASFTFLNSLLGDASASFGYRNFVNSSETEKFYRHRRYSEIHTVGGPPIRPGFTIDEWEKGLREKLVAIDRCGDPLHFAITPDSVPELPLPTVRHVATTVYNAINRYYKLNTHYGCTQQGSPNYEFHANIDDGSCQDPTINFTIGGVYQTCLVSPGSNVDLCDPENGGASQINPLTASFSCPAGYRAINLHSGMLSKLTHEWACNKQCEGCGFLWLSRCCKCNNVQKSRVSTATYAAFWCAPLKSMPTSSHGGYLFGGSYTTTIVNPITNAMTCPNDYIPLRLGSDIRICVSSDYELGLLVAASGLPTLQLSKPPNGMECLNPKQMATSVSKWI